MEGGGSDGDTVPFRGVGVDIDMPLVESDSAGFYTAKCNNHGWLRNRRAGMGVAAGGGEEEPDAMECFVPEGTVDAASLRLQEEEEDELLARELPANLADASPTSLKCTCFDPNCKLKRYFRFRSRQLEREGAIRAGGAAPEAAPDYSLLTDPGYPLGSKRERSLLEAAEGKTRPGLAAAHAALLSEAGGAALCRTVHDCCVGLSRRQPEMLTATASAQGDTVLMQLCARKPQLRADGGCDAKQKRLLTAQILAFARIYLEEAPDLLFVRNSQGTNAMELAALSNKSEVATMLALLYGAHGRDANESGGQGHTVLHLLARKGDDSADALESLLKIRKSSSATNGVEERLMRIDVVNEGRKTPLDVAVACREIFSTGRHRAIYERTIAAFHAIVAEDAAELFGSGASGADDPAQMSFRNF